MRHLVRINQQLEIPSKTKQYIKCLIADMLLSKETLNRITFIGKNWKTSNLKEYQTELGQFSNMLHLTCTPNIFNPQIENL